jgi:hypothetical protein
MGDAFGLIIRAIIESPDKRGWRPVKAQMVMPLDTAEGLWLGMHSSVGA